MFLFLMATGLTLILGVMGIVNFAHGSFYMIAAYLMYYITWQFGHISGVFWIALVIATLVIALIGGGLQKTLISRLYARPELQLLFTYALVLIFSDLIKMAFGVLQHGVPYPALLGGTLDIMDMKFPVYNLFITILGPIVAILLMIANAKTRWGRIIRAAAVDREMISALGIDIEKVFVVVFMIGAGLGGLGGALASPMSSVIPGMDASIILPAFVVVIIGGMGSFLGTFLSALITGQVIAFGYFLIPRLSESLIFILMAVILIFRPWGISNKPPIV
jgi:branched-subunit amino acid ABC-type transport system permease component